jgi:hypothetical protein
MSAFGAACGAKRAAKSLVASPSLPPLTIRRRESRPEHVALLGACQARVHDAFVGLAGAGKLGTTSNLSDSTLLF